MEHTNSNAEIISWETIEEQLPSCLRSSPSARRLFPKKFPAYMGTKITDIETPLRMVLYHAGTGASLKETAAAAAAAGLASISHVALHKWMSKIGPYLADLCSRIACDDMRFDPARWSGYEVIAADTSASASTKASGASIRVCCAIRLKDLHPLELKIRDRKSGETYSRFRQSAQKKQLWIGDEAFADPVELAAAKSRGIEVLVRCDKSDLPLYDRFGRFFNPNPRLLSLKKPAAIREWEVAVHPREHSPVLGRLCAVRLPDAERKRVPLSRKKVVTAEDLENARFATVFTTVPREALSASQALDLYRLRRRSELLFNRYGARGGLSGVPNFKPKTVYSWIYAKLLVLLVTRKILSSGGGFSPSARKNIELDIFSSKKERAELRPTG